MKTFLQFLDLMEASRRPGTKSGLYPLGYDGIGNYPQADIITRAADALYYMSQDHRLFRYWDGSPFSITNVSGSDEIVKPKNHGMPGKEEGYGPPQAIPQPKYKLPPGDIRTPKESPLPGAPKADNLVKDPELLDPHKEPSQQLKPWKP